MKILPSVPDLEKEISEDAHVPEHLNKVAGK